MQAALISEMSVTTYKTTRCDNEQVQNFTLDARNTPDLEPATT
jgi:hypothetical protein